MLHLSSSYILVNDMDRSAEFYSKLFGEKPTIITPDRWIQFDFDGNVLAICNQLFDLKTIAGGGDIDSIYSKAYISRLSKHRTVFGNNIVHKFETDDLSKEHIRISKIHGGIISDILYMNIESPYSFFTVADPDGNVIEVFGEYAAPEQQIIEDKDEKNNLKATIIEKPPVATPVIEKPVTAAPVPEIPSAAEIVPEKPVTEEPEIKKPKAAEPEPERQLVFKPAPEKQEPAEIVPEKPVTEEPEIEKPKAAEPEPERQLVFKPTPEKQEPAEIVPEKQIAAEPEPEKVKAIEPETEKTEMSSPTIDKSFKDKSILKAAIEKEKAKEIEDKANDQPVFISPNWEEIADRLKKSVIEKTSRPGTSGKEKEASPVKPAETEPVKKIGERPGLRPIIAEEKPMVLEDSTDDEPAVMTPIWEESYGKNKKPAVEKNHSPTTAAKEVERKADKAADDTPRRKSSIAEEKGIEPEPEKIEEAPVLPPIVVKNIRNAMPVKEPERKSEKHPAEKPIFKPIAKDKEKETEKEPKKTEKPSDDTKNPAEETEKPAPLPPPIWEKPSGDLWGDQRK